MKLIVCQSCEAEFQIKHSLNDRHYKIVFCPFCGSDVDLQIMKNLKMKWNGKMRMKCQTKENECLL